MLEKELKVLLTQPQYDDLAKKTKFEKNILQINFYYIDKNRDVLDKDITIRIRVIMDEMLLQVKIPANSNEVLLPSIRQKEEFEKEVKEIPYRISKETIYQLCGKNIGDVFLSGYMITERMEGIWNPGIKICLDKNTYLKTVDYELEVEYEKDINEQLKEFLKEQGINIYGPAKGKKSRYFAVCMK